MASSIVSLIAYACGALLFFTTPYELFTNATSPHLWALVIILMAGSVAGNLRMIALSTTVTFLFSEHKDKANGLIGAVGGVSFSLTSVLSGLAIGFYGMHVALVAALIATILVLVHLSQVRVSEPDRSTKTEVVPAEQESKKKGSIRETIALVGSVPGLFGLIFFTTFNNFLGGVFMALMDPYGLSMVSVQTWGMMFAILSFGFIAGSAYIAKFGLGTHPLRRLLLVNVICWITCIFFVIQPSIILLAVGMFVWMTLSPFIEATEQTIIQSVVPYEKQGRVFGFAQSVESAATPITAFLIGPIAQFVFIPFMTTGAGVMLIGDWFGVGAARGIALVFMAAGAIGLVVTLLAFRSRAYRILSAQYAEVQKNPLQV